VRAACCSAGIIHPATGRWQGTNTQVGIPVTLAEVGLQDLPAELLQQVAARATAKGETIHNEPFEVRPDMVADAIRAADALGRAWKKQESLTGGKR
jgi:glycerol dehydrogenase-like iron-containing ADH family enzyme